jgi:hypothetical protein
MSETTAVVVIDQNGRSHDFDADDFKDDGAYLEIVKGSERVARFAPGYIGVYRTSGRAAPPAAQVPALAGAGAEQPGGDAQ